LRQAGETDVLSFRCRGQKGNSGLNNLTLSDWKDVATIIGAAIALGTLMKTLIEYTKQGAQKRAEQFEKLRVRFKDDQMFKQICDLLEDDGEDLEKMPFRDKRDFLGFFEELALMVNSGLMNKAVAHYMFGYTAVRLNSNRISWLTFSMRLKSGSTL
jgi:hypothetical protein